MMVGVGKPESGKSLLGLRRKMVGPQAQYIGHWKRYRGRIVCHMDGPTFEAHALRRAGVLLSLHEMMLVIA
jgi:hypothetical protein